MTGNVFMDHGSHFHEFGEYYYTLFLKKNYGHNLHGCLVSAS